MKFKLFLYSLFFICSLTGIQAVSADELDTNGTSDEKDTNDEQDTSDEQDTNDEQDTSDEKDTNAEKNTSNEQKKRKAAGTIKLFLSGGLVLPELQTIGYKDKNAYEPTDSGVGFVLDINPGRGNHAVAVDYYTFKEEYSESESSVRFESEIEENFNVLLLGYRYHFNFGLYVGGGLMNLNDPTITAVVDTNENSENEVILGYKSVSPLALTLGYNHVFTSGFTIGAHLLRSSPVDLELTSYSIDGRSIDLAGADTSDFDIKDFIIETVGLGIGYSW